MRYLNRNSYSSADVCKMFAAKFASDHVSYMVNKASRSLGFIFRVAKGFEDIYCLKALFAPLSSLIWNIVHRFGARITKMVSPGSNPSNVASSDLHYVIFRGKTVSNNPAM